jgi:hypothetical protein
MNYLIVLILALLVFPLTFVDVKAIRKKKIVYSYFVLVVSSLIYLIFDYNRNPQDKISFIILIVLVAAVNIYKMFNKKSLNRES